MRTYKEGYLISTTLLPATEIWETMVFRRSPAGTIYFDELFMHRGEDEFESHLEGLVWVYEHSERITP